MYIYLFTYSCVRNAFRQIPFDMHPQERAINVHQEYALNYRTDPHA